MVQRNASEGTLVPLVLSDVEGRRRRARALATFWVLTVAGTGIGAGVGATLHHPVVGAAVGGLAGAVLGTAATVVMTVWPLLRAVWHWLAELTVVATGVAVVTAWAGVTGSWWWSTAFLPLIGAVVLVRPVRRRVVAFVWCAIVRHRLRVCFAAFIRARNQIHPGLAPLILLARPTPAGERVWVWLRTGLDIGELENRTAMIAVACWASDVQVTGSRRYAALVRIDVTRRDPLTRLVTSPLSRLIPGAPARAETTVDVPAAGLDLDEVPEIVALPAQRGGAR